MPRVGARTSLPLASDRGRPRGTRVTVLRQGEEATAGRNGESVRPNVSRGAAIPRRDDPEGDPVSGDQLSLREELAPPGATGVELQGGAAEAQPREVRGGIDPPDGARRADPVLLDHGRQQPTRGRWRWARDGR